MNQWICRAEPTCLCAGADACECDRNPATNICGDCGQPMEEIDFATGEAPNRDAAGLVHGQEPKGVI